MCIRDRSLSWFSCMNTNSADEFGNKVQGCGTEDAKILYCYTVLLIIVISIFLNFLAHWHKAAGRKTRLDIQNYGGNGNLLCYHIVVERNRNSKGMKKITLRNTKKVHKSNWNEPYSSSSSFTKQSCRKMALYRWIKTEIRWNKNVSYVFYY